MRVCVCLSCVFMFMGVWGGCCVSVCVRVCVFGGLGGGTCFTTFTHMHIHMCAFKSHTHTHTHTHIEQWLRTHTHVNRGCAHTHVPKSSSVTEPLVVVNGYY